VFNGGNPSAVTEDGLFTCVVVGISDQGRNEFSPKSFTLFQNVPNPFNATTIIRYRLPEKAKVTLWIYNLRGQRVSSLVNNVQNPGDYRIQWDARDLPSGVYFARLQANQFISIRKILLIK
ncbi:T9SS type A sorting domain-containing protein, partial [candidate division KSB1 bacterium]|nr:T9SS type A sorting domain-containing protein [candidate division KSB1 bacterium]